MQLTQSEKLCAPSPLRRGLAAAVFALLGSLAGPSPATEVDSGVLVYSEPNRVTGVESVVQVSRELANGQSVGVKLVFDSLTGASANGATPARRVQTFTRPSGRGGYQVAPGATPLDDTFKDTRFAGSGTWKRPWGRFTTTTLGLNASTEIDYLSLGLSGSVSRELFLKNTVVGASFSLSRDRINPQGGTPTPFTSMAPPSEEPEEDDDFVRPGGTLGDNSRSMDRGLAGSGELRDDDEGERRGGPMNKTVSDALFSVSQILDRATVIQFNYSLGRASGYQTDPYKILSVLDGPLGSSPGEPVDYVFEKRPDTRTKQSVYAEVKRRIGSHVADVSYRYFWDDWEVRSHTFDVRYTHAIGSSWEIEPHLRFYNQKQADLYRRFLVSGTPFPRFVSADYRLGSFGATTFGLGVGHRFENGQRLTVDGEYYLQHGNEPSGAYGQLVGMDLFPDVDAIMFRVGYTASFDW